MKLLFATWGEPSLWREVSYRFEGKEDKNCSTLKLLKEVLHPDRVILLVNDTLVGKNRTPNSNCRREEKNICSLDFQGKSYGEVDDFIKGYIRENLKAFGTSAEDIWVLPSVGYFSNAIAIGELSDLRYYLFVEFFKNFEQLLQDEKLEIYLDITHGQNFLPTITYEVLKSVLEIAAFFVKEIKFTMLNSDPFTYAAKPSFLEIHKVLERKIKPKPYLYYIDKSNFIAPYKGINMREVLKPIQKIKDEIPLKLNESIPAFLGAVYNALPLVIFYTYLNPWYIECLTDTVIDIYKNHINVSEQNGKIVLTRSLKLRPEVEVFSVYGMFLKGLTKQFPSLQEYASYKKDKSDVKVPLHAVKEVSFNFLSYNNRNQAILEKEIGDLDRITKKFLKEDSDWIDYKTIEGSKKEEVDNSQEEGENNLTAGYEIRNFLAHAGLSKNTLQLKMENGEIYLRYKFENADIYDWSRKGLEKL